MDNTVYIISQIISTAALICSVISYQSNNKNRLLLLLLCTGIAYTVSFILLGELTGILMNIYATIRCFIFSQSDKHKWASNRPLWIGIFFALLIGIGVYVFGFTETEWYDFFPFIAMAITTVALSMKKPTNIRIVTIFNDPFWIVYDAMVKQIPGVLNEIFVMVSIIIAMFRHDILPKIKSKKQQQTEIAVSETEQTEEK